MANDATTRFTSRVEDYVRYRPGYPAGVFSLLSSECGLGPDAAVADVGSGTGISARLLLERGATVYAVEPNAAMRTAAEWALKPLSPLGERRVHREMRSGALQVESGEGAFISLEGTSESTGLPDGSVDLVTAFQAFHWFDRAAARREFARILKPNGFVALVWNERVEVGSPFLEGYEALLREFAGDYLAVRHNAISEADLQDWFGGTMRTATFENSQSFDFEGVLGRLMSSSYAPLVSEPRYEPMVAELRRLFDATQDGGTVDFLYETTVFYGRLDSSGS